MVRSPSRAAVKGGSFGWDGEQGPFLRPGAQVVNFADAMRSDYPANALGGHCNADPLAGIDSQALIERMDALRAAIAAVDAFHSVASTPLWLVHAACVPDWAQCGPCIPALSGAGYRYVFVLPTSETPRCTPDLKRLEQPYAERLECHVAAGAVRWSRNQGAWSLHKR